MPQVFPTEHFFALQNVHFPILLPPQWLSPSHGAPQVGAAHTPLMQAKQAEFGSGLAQSPLAWHVALHMDGSDTHLPEMHAPQSLPVHSFEFAQVLPQVLVG